LEQQRDEWSIRNSNSGQPDEQLDGSTGDHGESIAGVQLVLWHALLKSNLTKFACPLTVLTNEPATMTDSAPHAAVTC